MFNFRSLSMMLSAWTWNICCCWHVSWQLKYNLKSPRLLLGFKCDKTITFWNPCTVLNNFGLLYISKCWKQGVKLRFCCRWTDATNKHSEIKVHELRKVFGVFCGNNFCKMWYQLGIFVFWIPKTFESFWICTLVVFILNWKRKIANEQYLLHAR